MLGVGKPLIQAIINRFSKKPLKKSLVYYFYFKLG